MSEYIAKKAYIAKLNGLLAEAEADLAALSRRRERLSWPTFKYAGDSITYMYDPERRRFGSDFSDFRGTDDVTRLMNIHEAAKIAGVEGFFPNLLTARYVALLNWAIACTREAP